MVAQTNTALGSTTGGTTVNGGTLDLGGTLGANTLNLPAEVITISGTGVGGNGALVNNGCNDQTNAVEQLVLGADATIGGTKRWDVRGTGNTFNMAGKTLTKNRHQYRRIRRHHAIQPRQHDVVQGVIGFHPMATSAAPPPTASPSTTAQLQISTSQRRHQAMDNGP